MFVNGLLSILIIFSPLWPLGVNPTSSDPFLIINKSTNQLALIDEGTIQHVYFVGTGKTEELTPEGMFTITVKAVQPYYRKKDIPGGDPKNPLGTRWIGFDANNTEGRTFGVHGTNRPDSIGHYVSAGCIRMLNQDVEEVFSKVPLGTRIYITRGAKSFQQMGEEAGAIPTKRPTDWEHPYFFRGIPDFFQHDKGHVQ
ncbi:L,D-transpeptidase [Bacillus fonticola]|uniref:L,D-transpeptidase n=1 Tax=Bacillus fonticola TaxID=2728853 RepID=UPI001476214B|nr:L,D-transpeptidase [Bacillus fonticola]